MYTVYCLFILILGGNCAHFQAKSLSTNELDKASSQVGVVCGVTL